MRPIAVEPLESRVLMATFTVVNVNDSGSGSLRQAITNANNSLGSDTIQFAIAGAGPHVIVLNDALPHVTGPTIIDARSESPDAGATKGVALDGSGVSGADPTGLRLLGDGSDVRGLAIGGFALFGIAVVGHNVTVAECYVGTNAAGSAVRPNGSDGVIVEGDNCRIGSGATGIPRNVISGNAGSGVRLLASSTGATIQNNFIGTDLAGNADLGNGAHGVHVVSSSGNLIGFTAPDAAAPNRRNFISGNGGDGVRIERLFSNNVLHPSASNNTVAGNYIGINRSLNAANPNGGRGVNVIDCDANTIGSMTARNIVSGNAGRGINIGNVRPDVTASNNVVDGNFVGTDASGTIAVPNGLSGVGVTGANASGNRVGGDPTGGVRNLISGNGSLGVGVGGTQNEIRGNYIGTDITGTLDLGNVESGVQITDGSLIDVARNLISGNGTSASSLPAHGVFITVSTAAGAAPLNEVYGNRIGTNAAGDAPIGNKSAGVRVASASSNIIGGQGEPNRNVISGNGDSGVEIDRNPGFPQPTSNRVSGNYIGLSADGTADLGNGQNGIFVVNAHGTRIGGTAPEEGNVISGNASDGVRLGATGATAVVVATSIRGNFIGTDAAGQAALGNGGNGIFLAGASVSPTLIGRDAGDTASAGNLISGNGARGINIEGSNGNGIFGNMIGTNVDATARLGNAAQGVLVRDASATLIGSASAGRGNVISANNGTGIYVTGDSPNTIVYNNRIGTNDAGAANLGNGANGVLFDAGTPVFDFNGIVSGTPAFANHIAYNNADGIRIVSGQGVSIFANRMHDNGQLAIDLGPDGVTGNDVLDTDAGANYLQNFPVLTAATYADGAYAIHGTLSSVPNTGFYIDLYAQTSSPDPSGFGEADVYLRNLFVTTNASGDVSFAVDHTAPLYPRIVATAVAQSDLSTSEFSAPLAVTQPDTTPPTVIGSSFDFNLASPQRLSFAFSESVSASLQPADLLIDNLTTGQQLFPTAVAYDPPTNTARFTFPQFANGVLPDGDYRATLRGALVQDDAGNLLDGDGNGLPGGNYLLDFYFLNGDANRDRRANLQDFNILAANFGQSQRTFGQGDFTYDGQVNLQDFNILAARFGLALGPAPLDAARGAAGDECRKLADELDELLN